MPAARFDLSDAASILGRHQILPDTLKRSAATTQLIQRAVYLKGLVGDLIVCEKGDVVMDLGIGRACILRNFPLRLWIGLGRGLFGYVADWRLLGRSADCVGAAAREICFASGQEQE